jgi:peptidoglycan/xylan/chitin deacetylase (PgdA/CDA1 family)
LVGEIQNLIRFADKAIADVYLRVRREQPAVICFLFHSLFRDQAEIDRNLVDPLQRTTVTQFRRFIEYYLACGYRFVDQNELLGGLPSPGKYALITFDDGYFNNHLARPVLEEFGIPALFFISTDHVVSNRSFWWDVLYRERKAEGATTSQIYREGVALKTLRTTQIEEILRRRFGDEAFVPRGDIDRPFTPNELREFQASPSVFLGNHTHNHAILTNYPSERLREEIAQAQQWLSQISSKPVLSIAYPNGAFDQTVMDICTELGLRIGFTVKPMKNTLPLPAPAMLQLSRFAPDQFDSIESQCRTYRSDLLIYYRFRDAYLRLAGRRVVR